MSKTKKTFIVGAAIAGLVAGSVSMTKAGSNQSSVESGKQASLETPARNGCNGCPGHTSTNSVNKN